MFNRRILFISLIFCIFALGASCRNSNLEKKTLTLCKSDGTELSVKAEIAVKPEDRNFGFMERKNIPDGTGMLFVFEYDQILSFWMKNTPHPLSIAFIDSNGKIRDIFQMSPYSLSSVSSTTSVRYALEVPQGWFKKEGIKEGDYLTKEK